ncbi:HlyD family type I secretion periplasmic adaptor subunit [Arvimicrobium flavum]|uniref:HlyD family type I secretion periplasmic adaptor subunit n=1 Tax=Arvimicrobium flavum TaxID=3393320 RepID=UPI00237BF2CE|nr:HlyD family type I secretion periplasmic adaptor subunit [Mesorhizobium shangrilense]
MSDQIPQAKSVVPVANKNWFGPAAFGYTAIVLAFVVGGGWSAFARVDSAVIAPGVISIESNRKTVQHYEGGIVREIRVKEGDFVKPDAVLFELDTTEARANVSMVRAQLDSALALEARLVAERDHADAIDFPEELLTRQDQPVTAASIIDQEKQFNQRRDALAGQMAILTSRIEQLNTEIGGLGQEAAATRRQLEAIDDELDSKQQLYKKKLIAKSQVLALEREKARLEGVVGRSVADTAKAEGSIGETKLQIQQLEKQFLEDVNAQILEARQKISDLRQRFVVANDVFDRLVVKAPLGGYVQNLKVFTRGAVIQSGQPLLDLVPVDEPLIIQARVSPLDKESVRVDMQAEVRFPSFKATDFPLIYGKVRSVSNDRFVDEQSGQAYFLALVQVEDDEVDSVQEHLTAGLPAEVIMPTGERTVLQYLIDPMLERLRTSMREE